MDTKTLEAETKEAGVMPWVGIGYRRELASWIAQRPAEVQCVEVTAEHFFDANCDLLRDLTRDYPVFVHGLSLSLGTPGSLDAKTLQQFAEVVEAADPVWVSEHIAFTRSQEVDLGHLNPLQPDRRTLEVVAEHARQVADTCGRPIVLENISSHLQVSGEMSEPEFLNLLCERAECGLLLDVTNLFINSRNHGFDPVNWLHALNPQSVVQLHVVGYSEQDGCYHDSHAEPIQDDLRELIHEVLDYAPVQAVTLERDANFPDPGELGDELKRLSEAIEQHRPYHSDDATPERPRAPRSL